jgi:hypothetical protein
MDVIRKHWQGVYPLGVSFWLVFIALGAVYHFAEPVVLEPFADRPEAYIQATIAYLVASRLIVFPWQVIGLLRAADRHYLTHGRPIIRYVIQAAVVMSLAFTVAHIIGAAQSLVIYKDKIDFEKTRAKKNYTIRVLDDGRRIHLEGPLDFGITEALSAMLRDHPGIRSIILESEGGQIYEGRGLALLIDRYGLDTYAFEDCSSACTTAFIGGRRRYLGPRARLGFHRYRLDSGKALQYHKYHDMDAEHAKDMQMFRAKKIKQDFIDRVFRTPHDRMWYPDAGTLIGAGVATGVVDGM